jgi:hypothetical protein
MRSVPDDDANRPLRCSIIECSNVIHLVAIITAIIQSWDRNYRRPVSIRLQGEIIYKCAPIHCHSIAIARQTGGPAASICSSIVCAQTGASF